MNLGVDVRPYICGMLYGMYPILAKRSNLSSGASFFILTFITVLFSLVPFAQNGAASVKAASFQQIGFMVASGMVSSLGLFVMFRFIAATADDKVGALVVAMIVTQVLFTCIASSIMLRSVPSLRQVLGIVLVSGGIYLVNAKK